MKERAIAVLAGLQRNATAMNVLRSNLESRISHTMGNGGRAESCQELTRILVLVKNGEMILNELTLKAESARFLEEFIRIIDSASTSFGEIKHDLQELVPVAEAALSEIHDAIAGITPETPTEIRQEVELSVLAQQPIDINERKQSLANKVEGQKEVAVPQREPKHMQEIEERVAI
ncbi:MAG TPA: hypothetical protein VIE86_01935 [Nitrososphaera sp.]|jgi:hypothetical protein